MWDAQEAKPPQNVTQRNPKYAFKVGDHVHISKVKRAFAKGYLPSWTEEVFTISQIIDNVNPPQYKIKDYHGEEIQGSFYAAELEHITKPDTYIVETIVGQHRNKKGQKEYLVKWLGYTPQFNSWERLDNTVAHNILYKQT